MTLPKHKDKLNDVMIDLILLDFCEVEMEFIKEYAMVLQPIASSRECKAAVPAAVSNSQFKLKWLTIKYAHNTTIIKKVIHEMLITTLSFKFGTSIYGS